MTQGNSNLFENRAFANMPEGIRPGGITLTKRLVDYCNIQPGARAVDVGCGTGTTVEYLRAVRGAYAVGVDLSAVLLQQGTERTADLHLIQSSGEELPFWDSSIEIVLAECSLSVMSNVHQVLAEINRILIPGGKLAITDLYVRDTSCDLSTSATSSIMTQGELNQVLQEHGFEIIVFEDQSKFLRAFVAGFIMEHGSTEKICQCAGIQSNNQTAQGLGYYLLIAKKSS